MRIYAGSIFAVAATWMICLGVVGHSAAMPLAAQSKDSAAPAVIEQTAGYLPGLTELEDDDLDPAGKAPDDASSAETMSPGKGKSIMIEILKHS